MVEPTGVPASIAMIIPKEVQINEKKTAHIVTDLKLLNTLIADNAGKITSAEIKSAPTKFIAREITIAMVIARIKLYVFALMPVAVEKSSSKVIENIL